MAGLRWNQNLFYEPWHHLFHEMNRMFEDFPLGKWSEAQQYPPVNIWSTENDAVLMAQVPGVNPNELEINVLQDVITLRGTRKSAGEEGEYHRQERASGNFQRSFKLPFKVDANKVEAKYEKGILHVQLPRSEQDKPKQIKVKANS